MAKNETEYKTQFRIGISETSHELHFEVHLEATKIIALAEEAISGNKILDLTDIKNRRILVPANKISYLEIGDSTDQKVGFTSL
jgi:hypothetical protein